MEELRENLTCAICMEYHEDPLLLACAHSFCRACLEQIYSRVTDRRFMVCPMCQQNTPLGNNGISTLPRNCDLANIIEAFKQTENMASSSDRAEVDSAGARDSKLLYCMDCQMPISVKQLSKHQNHQTKDIEIVKKAQMDEVLLYQKRVSDELKKVKSSEKHIEELLKEAKKVRSERCDKVSADYDKLISALHKHQENATELIDGKYLDISRKLNEELDHIMIVVGDFNDIQQKGNRLVANSDAGSFMEYSKQFLCRPLPSANIQQMDNMLEAMQALTFNTAPVANIIEALDKSRSSGMSRPSITAVSPRIKDCLDAIVRVEWTAVSAANTYNVYIKDVHLKNTRCISGVLGTFCNIADINNCDHDYKVWATAVDAKRESSPSDVRGIPVVECPSFTIDEQIGEKHRLSSDGLAITTPKYTQQIFGPRPIVTTSKDLASGPARGVISFDSGVQYWEIQINSIIQKEDPSKVLFSVGVGNASREPQSLPGRDSCSWTLDICLNGRKVCFKFVHNSKPLFSVSSDIVGGVVNEIFGFYLNIEHGRLAIIDARLHQKLYTFNEVRGTPITPLFMIQNQMNHIGTIRIQPGESVTTPIMPNL